MSSKIIAALSPSGIHNPISFQKGIELLESWGHTVLCSPNYQSKYMYTAGTIEERLCDLDWALSNDSIDCIWFIRGGYGTAELLEQLKGRSFNKAVLGFSDATALLSYLWNQGSKMAYHAPVLNSLATLCDEESIERCRQWLDDGTLSEFHCEYLFGPSETIKAPMVGGNLCVLSSLSGTPYQLNARGCILALEDIAEPAYKIDRMLLQIQLSGGFDGVKGIVLGEFYNCNSPKDVDWDLIDVFKRRLSNLNIPVYHKAPFGHHRCNWIWNLGQHTLLERN